MYIVHHFGSISAWGLCAVTGYAHVIAVPALLMEVTGPFVNGRYFLSTAGLKDTTLYTVNGVMMFLTFLIFRVVFNWWLYLSRFWWQFSLMWQCPVALVICFNLLYPLDLPFALRISKAYVASVARDRPAFPGPSNPSWFRKGGGWAMAIAAPSIGLKQDTRPGRRDL